MQSAGYRFCFVSAKDPSAEQTGTVRDAAAHILESTTIADIARMPSGPSKKSKGTEAKITKFRASAREKHGDAVNKTIPMPRKEHTS